MAIVGEAGVYDMEWADSSTWDALEYLLAKLERDRVLLCLTIRTEDAPDMLLERRRRLSRDERFHELTLRRLTSDEVKHKPERGRQLPGSAVSSE